MTPNEPDSRNGPERDPNIAPIFDRVLDPILDHNRLQLSALMDGELSPDEARFLLRRLEHDEELRGCWERWQFGGDVMRGLGAMVPADFAGRVASAVAANAAATRAPSTSTQPRWARWGGGAALAASVAVIALFLARQSPQSPAPATAPESVAVTQPAPASARSATPVAPAPAPDRVAQLATAVAVAEAPRKVLARRSRGQSQRAALRASRANGEVAVAANAAPAISPTAIDPFSGQAVSLPNRPWPRALLPGTSASGAFTVDYGSRVDEAAATHPFYPFVPRPMPPPAPDDAQTQTDSRQR